MMQPSVLDAASPWSNLWIISSALYALVWAVAIATALTAAGAVPYLIARTIARRIRKQTRTTTSRMLILTAFAVVVLMAVIVVGLAYSASLISGDDDLGYLPVRPGNPPPQAVHLQLTLLPD